MPLLKHISDALVALGPGGVLLLAFLDSSGVPVAAGVDALLIFLAIQSPGTAWLSAFVAVAGSTTGNLLLFSAARRGGRRFLERAAQPGRAQTFRNWFHRYGLVTVFVPALIPFPMPLKLFVISAGITGAKRSRFLGTVLIARILRYGAAVALGLVMGKNSTAFLKAHVWHFAVIGVAIFAALYLLIRWNDSARRALNSPTEVPTSPDRHGGLG